MSVSVCLSVCLSLHVCLSAIIGHLSSELHIRSLPTFFCLLHVAVARSSSGGVVIRCVLPVLWMTSYLLDVAAQPRRSSHAASGLAVNGV